MSVGRLYCMFFECGKCILRVYECWAQQGWMAGSSPKYEQSHWHSNILNLGINLFLWQGLRSHVGMSTGRRWIPHLAGKRQYKHTTLHIQKAYTSLGTSSSSMPICSCMYVFFPRIAIRHSMGSTHRGRKYLDYTARIAILLCICSSTYAWHIHHGAYAVYTPWCICSLST